MREKLETLSVSVLKEFAKDKHIKNISTMRKSELIDAIIAANEAEGADGYKSLQYRKRALRVLVKRK